jgi:hypothetical protein
MINKMSINVGLGDFAGDLERKQRLARRGAASDGR